MVSLLSKPESMSMFYARKLFFCYTNKWCYEPVVDFQLNWKLSLSRVFLCQCVLQFEGSCHPRVSAKWAATVELRCTSLIKLKLHCSPSKYENVIYFKYVISYTCTCIHKCFVHVHNGFLCMVSWDWIFSSTHLKPWFLFIPTPNKMHQANCLVRTAKSTCLLFMIYVAYLHVTCSEIALCDDVETSLRYLPPLRPALPLSSLQNFNYSLYLLI